MQNTKANAKARIFTVVKITVMVLLWGGILYAASGILFPLPTALLVNTAGTILMTGVPFFIGKRTGTKLPDKLIQKNGRLRQLQSIESQNEFFVSLAFYLLRKKKHSERRNTP